MPKEILQASRSDFRGGKNSASNPELLSPNELTLTNDCRISDALGSVEKRTGSRRRHAAAIGSGNPVTGLYQWIEPTGGALQTVAICNGNLYHKTSEYGNFTEVVPSPTFSTTARQRFAQFRATTSGAPLRLYIFDGVEGYEYDGVSTLVALDLVNSVPDATVLVPYHTRMFYNNVLFPKNLFWSIIGNAASCVTGGISDGGSAIVDVLSGEQILALEVGGGSLIIGTKTSLSRFTGFSNEDIRIEQDTEGISGDVGTVGSHSLARCGEDFVATIADNGFYLVTEAGATDISSLIQPDFDGLDLDVLSRSSVAYHKARREIWFAVPNTGAANAWPRTVWIYSLNLRCFFGPFTYPFDIRSLAAYEDPSGVVSVMCGGEDGFVRWLDPATYRDDALSDGTGGSAYNMLAEFAPFTFESKRTTEKSLWRAMLAAEIPSGVTATLHASADNGAFASYNVVGTAASRQPYRVDLAEQGRIFTLRFRDGSATSAVKLHGLDLLAYDLGRIV